MIFDHTYSSLYEDSDDYRKILRMTQAGNITHEEEKNDDSNEH